MLQPFGVVAETAADIDALQRFIVGVVRLAQIVGHGFRVVEVGDSGGIVRLPGEQDGVGAAGEFGLVLGGEGRDGEGVPAEGVGVGKVCSHAGANSANPNPMKPGCDNRHVKTVGVIKRVIFVRDHCTFW